MDREVALAVPLPTSLPVDEVLTGSPEAWLPDARSQGGRWLVSLTAVGVERPVACTVSPPGPTRSGIVRQIAWEPLTTTGDLLRGDLWLPGFDGQLRLVGWPDEPSLVLTGHVRLPLGIVGLAADGMGLGAVADRSLDEFLRRVATRVTDAARATRVDSPAG